MIKKLLTTLLGTVIMTETAFLVYPYFQRRNMDSFNCVANIVQHYSDDVYHLSLNYMIRDNFALAHITGRSDMNPEKIFNRKVSFRLQRKGDIYYMAAEKNIQLPDDNLSEDEISQYISRFFIASDKEVYMRIMKQRNDNFIFIVNSIPTYVCNAISL
ncbi:hypothetical protein NGC37_18420 [Pantoea anthophila]|uniref:hypothetical protein n=1 Tax=Pantoea anthophila TaxID=470931 RepID=UPI002DB629C4|nr:hypothetical protein [Pantoea anthophila]MEB7540280.1 hypothetical protein [Pantoea anthophila]